MQGCRELYGLSEYIIAFVKMLVYSNDILKISCENIFDQADIQIESSFDVNKNKKYVIILSEEKDSCTHIFQYDTLRPTPTQKFIFALDHPILMKFSEKVYFGLGTSQPKFQLEILSLSRVILRLRAKIQVSVRPKFLCHFKRQKARVCIIM